MSMASQKQLGKSEKFDLLRTEHLKNFIDTIIQRDKQALNDQVFRIMQENLNFDIASSLTELENLGIDPQLYCDKTGQPVKKHAIDKLHTLLKIHGAKNAKLIIDAESLQTIHPAWLLTNGEALEKLSIHDPYGYFVYASAKVLESFYYHHMFDKSSFHLQKEINNAKQKSSEAFGLKNQQKLLKLLLHEERKICYQNACKTPLNEIVEANEMLRRFLSLFKMDRMIAKGIISNDGMFLKKLNCTDFICSLQHIKLSKINAISFSQDLKQLMRFTLYYYQEKGYLKRTISYDDAIRFISENMFGGYGNFRHQRKLRNMTETELVQYELAQQGWKLPETPEEHVAHKVRIAKQIAQEMEEKRHAPQFLSKMPMLPKINNFEKKSILQILREKQEK